MYAMPNEDASPKPGILRLWWTYYKGWFNNWLAEMRSPHMTSHALSALAGIISLSLSFHYDPSLTTWTKVWHARLVLLVGMPR